MLELKLDKRVKKVIKRENFKNSLFNIKNKLLCVFSNKNNLVKLFIIGFISIIGYFSFEEIGLGIITSIWGLLATTVLLFDKTNKIEIDDIVELD